jgi:transaldolase
MGTGIGGIRTKIFADGADKSGIIELNRKHFIKGFTTNPTLIRKAGITDYAGFAKDILRIIPDKPFSFEVFADDFAEMERQAGIIANWGENVYVKIPITNTAGMSSSGLIRRLASKRLKLNITAVMTIAQVREVVSCLGESPSSYVSIFAGRIADTGVDPMPLMSEAVDVLKPHKNLELIWASPREILNIFHADAVGCHIITVTHDLLRKIDMIGKDLGEFSLETVKMFFEDGRKTGFII